MMYERNDELNFFGLPEMVNSAIEKVEIEARRELLSTIVTVGGNSLIPRFIERLQKELFELDLYGLSTRSKVYTVNEVMDRIHSNWLGGSIMASMSSFDSIVMTKEDYEEHGSILIERKCFS